MRCQADVKVWYKVNCWYEGKLIERCTWTMQQCSNTTKQKNAACWNLDPPLCGYHAAQKFPDLYPKSKGHKTGGRHGKNSTNVLFIEPIKIAGS